MSTNVIDDKQLQLAIGALRIAQTHAAEALARNPDDADLDGVWTSIENALRQLGCDDSRTDAYPVSLDIH